MNFMSKFVLHAGLICMIAIVVNAKDITKNMSEDLDGDNKAESLSLKVNIESGQFTLTINGKVVDGKMYIEDEGNLEKEIGMKVIDIDKRDKFKEVEVFYDGGRYDLRNYYYYSFDANTIYLINNTDQNLTFNGYGIVLVNTWLDFWNKTEKYILNNENHRLEKVPQAFYYVGAEVSVSEMFPIYRDKDKKDVVANLSPNSQCIILLVDPSGWYVIKSSTGLVGWTNDISKLQLPSAG